MQAKIVLIEGTNFVDFPTGGSGTFGKNLLHEFGPFVALVGISTSKADKIGVWGKKVINGIEYDYLPLKFIEKNYKRKPIIPARLFWFFALRKYLTTIMEYGCVNIFIQSPDTLFAVSNWKGSNICYRFAGLSNPLSMSRYKWARLFVKLFEYYFTSKLKFVKTFFASASMFEIKKYSYELSSHGINIHIIQLPTRVDTKIFYPQNRNLELRFKLGLKMKDKIIVTSGRLSEVKGWNLLLDSFRLFLQDFPDSYFILIGNGEDKSIIEKYIKRYNISDNVKLAGFLPQDKLAEYLNIANLYVMGSYLEGWPTSMIEALACNIPICSTNFNSVHEILCSEKFGIVVYDRNPSNFYQGMIKAMNLVVDKQVYLAEMQKYSLSSLKEQVLKNWILK